MSFEESSYEVDEGATAAVVVELNGRRSQELEIPITVSRDDAESSDYDVDGLIRGVLTFSEWHDEATFWIDTVEDVDGDDENLDLDFGRLPSGVRQGSPSRATVTIAEPAVASFDESSYTVVEGEDVTITVELDRPATQDLNIPINVRRGSAESADYSVVGLSRGMLAFDEDDESATFTISARTDNNDDDGETVNLSFGTLPEGVVAGTPSSATVTIEERIATSFGESAYTVVEGEDVTITVELDRPASQDLNIPINVRRGTAGSSDSGVCPRACARVRRPRATVTIAEPRWPASMSRRTRGSAESADSATFTFTISARTDNNDDDGETVNLSFGTLPEGVAAGTPSTATVTIAEPTVAPASASRRIRLWKVRMSPSPSNSTGRPDRTSTFP